MSHAGIYLSNIPYRAMDLVCFQSQGRLKFATPEEHAATPRAGRPKWTGTVAITTYGLGGSFSPGIWDKYTESSTYDGVKERVLAEGVSYNS